MAAILQFRLSIRRGWSPAEQAEFARTVAILNKAGVHVVCETGLSDEGDPWVIFVRHDTGDVVAHIARIDGQIVAASAATNDVVSGPNFRAIMDRIVRTQPLVMPPSTPSDRLYLHPAAVIVAFIATALAFAPEDDGRAYGRKWKLLDDGSLALATPEARSAGGILRDGLFSKAELARMGGDPASAHVSAPLVVAAIVAAAAVAVQSSEIWSEDARTASREGAGPLDPISSVVRQDANALADSTPSTDLAALRLDEDGRHNAVYVPFSPHETVAAPSDLHETMAAPEVHAPAMSESSAIPRLLNLTFLDINGGTTALTTSAEWKHEPAREAAGTSPQNRPVEPSVVHAEAPASALAAPLASDHAASVTPTITISSDAHELLSLLFPASHIPVESFTSSSFGTISLPVDMGTVTHGLLGEAPTLASHISTAPHDSTGQPASTPAAPDVPVVQVKSGYELIEGILAFTFDPAHQIGPTSSLPLLQQALHDRTFLPAGDHVLIIDVPELHNDIFHFSDGVTMMSQAKAQELLPDVQLHAQVEFALENGTSVKLIGVVDLHHAGAAYA